jgi:hypothetical protein
VHETLAATEPKLTKRRILATGPETDLYSIGHSIYSTTAFLPVYNHVVMALPVEPDHIEPITKQMEREGVNGKGKGEKDREGERKRKEGER